MISKVPLQKTKWRPEIVVSWPPAARNRDGLRAIPFERDPGNGGIQQHRGIGIFDHLLLEDSRKILLWQPMREKSLDRQIIGHLAPQAFAIDVSGFGRNR